MFESTAFEPSMNVKLFDAHIDAGREFLQGMVDNLYGDDQFNEGEFEHCLEEVLDLFMMKIPEKNLTIKAADFRKKQ